MYQYSCSSVTNTTNKLRTALKDRGKDGDEAKIRQLEDQLVDAGARLANTNEIVDQHMERFERQRTQDMQTVLEEYVRCQMHIHCRGLELLGPVATGIHAISPGNATIELARDNARLRV
jgi:hypothetical protein